MVFVQVLLLVAFLLSGCVALPPYGSGAPPPHSTHRYPPYYCVNSPPSFERPNHDGCMCYLTIYITNLFCFVLNFYFSISSSNIITIASFNACVGII